ncbi:hypothetical protein IZ6_02870 [Terrihabitans soli]|uniref:DUF218 domain-containing protein n=2 Tax=Terrihabitans soli TaxID=708113 RepID=A0A6S6QQJ3_9HYPH|nr:hypothetical protein IZ6_02870 [Terrihabitans soli]
MTEDPQTPRRRPSGEPSFIARMARTFATVAVIAAGLLVAGFFVFVSTIPRVEPDTKISGDGIVVLTGGADRLADAFALLADGRAKRLLISGVNPDTSEAQLARLHPQHKRLFDCCVDLGFRALNTAGNALETRQWVRRHGFQAVIVVTSGWHMRRSLLELERAIPEVILVPYPVITEGAEEENWWLKPGKLRLLVGEYVKYLAALVEVRIAPRISDEDPAPKEHASKK